MSALGNYVHLTWSGYKAAGTYSTHHSKNKKEKSNFSPYIFDIHYDSLRSQVAKEKITDLNKLETIYNQKNEQAADVFKRLNKENKTHHSILTYLLKKINAQWTDDFINEIINGLEWVDDIQNFRYTPTSRAKATIAKYTSKESASVPSLRWEGNWHLVSPVITYANNLHEYLKTRGAPDANKVARIQQELLKLKDCDTQIRSVAAKLGKGGVFDPNSIEGRWQTQLARQKLELDTIREKYLSVEEINRQIQQSMAEVLGSIVVDNTPRVSQAAFKQAIADAFSSGGRTLSEVTAKGGIITPNVKVAAEFEKEKENTTKSLFAQTGKTKDGRLEYAWRDLGTSRAQKSDVELVVDEQRFGVSVKNTALTAKNYKNKDGIVVQNQINLQSSSLLLYLAGMEEHWSNLGNHYLNILTTHQDVDSIYSTMRKEAIKSLKLYILWSALTGKGQLRSNKGAAQILAIYDKTSKPDAETNFRRVKFYDMSELIMKIADSNFTQGVSFSPSLDSLTIANEPEETAGIRLTKILIDARKKNISAALYTSFLT